MPKKLTYEFVKEQIEKESCILESIEYINAHQKLDYICPAGHKHSMSWNNWRRGHRCSICAGQGKPVIEFIRSKFGKENYVFRTKKYINNEQKLEYTCPNGHKHSISWSNWQKGRRCPSCAGLVKKTIEFIKLEFEKEGCILKSTEYVNGHMKLDYICPNGHRHSITWSNWQKGQRCPYCAGNGKPTIEFIRAPFEKEGFILLTTEYINNQQKLEYICPNGNHHNITWAHWQQGQRCPCCVGIISKGEIEVRNFIESIGIEISPNDRNQIVNPSTNCGLELDIFMPEFDKAVEYNGEYWHQDKIRDLLKQDLCELKGIDLLTIWDKEWLSNSGKCKDKIKGFVFNSERGLLVD